MFIKNNWKFINLYISLFNSGRQRNFHKALMRFVTLLGLYINKSMPKISIFIYKWQFRFEICQVYVAIHKHYNSVQNILIKYIEGYQKEYIYIDSNSSRLRTKKIMSVIGRLSTTLLSGQLVIFSLFTRQTKEF